jgi:predicted DCC family thiol-disulfide oxidoreductase YuxK
MSWSSLIAVYRRNVFSRLGLILFISSISAALSTNSCVTGPCSLTRGPLRMSSKGGADVNGDISNVILYDGVCNFCNTWVDIMLRLDNDKKFKFCALQSSKGRELLTKIGRNADDISTVVLIKLGFYIVSILGSLLPGFLRDGMYDTVAANRYRILGKRDKCRCEDDRYADRFI